MHVRPQIISCQCVLGCDGVQAASASYEPAAAFVSPAGGHQEPGQDCASGRRPPGPHGGGEGPAAGQRLH